MSQVLRRDWIPKLQARYRRTDNYEAVARLANLDRRTVKKYLQQPSKKTSAHSDP